MHDRLLGLVKTATALSPGISAPYHSSDAGNLDGCEERFHHGAGTSGFPFKAYSSCWLEAQYIGNPLDSPTRTVSQLTHTHHLQTLL